MCILLILFIYWFSPTVFPVLTLYSITSSNSVLTYELQLEILMNKLKKGINRNRRHYQHAEALRQHCPVCLCARTSRFLLCKKRKIIFLCFFLLSFCSHYCWLVVWVIRGQNPKNTIFLISGTMGSKWGQDTQVPWVSISVGSTRKAFLDVRPKW